MQQIFTPLMRGNQAFRQGNYQEAAKWYKQALSENPDLRDIIEFNFQLLSRRGINYQPFLNTEKLLVSGAKNEEPKPLEEKKLPITVLVITWDVGHNPLGRSYMLAEVVHRIARNCILVGFQFPRYGDAIWQPVRNGSIPVVALPGNTLPDFHQSLARLSQRIAPDIVIACKPRLPSVELGFMIRERWGCPLIIDVDDHELAFFPDSNPIGLNQLCTMPYASAKDKIEPYGELWTRLTQSLISHADAVLVSNEALRKTFGGKILPHVRNEIQFNPDLYVKDVMRKKYGVPVQDKVVLFFGTPRIHKGLDKLAKAVAELQDHNFSLLVVGDSPDRSVTNQLKALAGNRLITLPNQPFDFIAEIVAMADVVCLPQDDQSAVSAYQLPAKAIDAVAMSVPLLVSNTPPLQQLVDDGVAQFVDLQNLPNALLSAVYQSQKDNQKLDSKRSTFLNRYSYAAAAKILRQVFATCLKNKSLSKQPVVDHLIKSSCHVLGVPELSPWNQSGVLRTSVSCAPSDAKDIVIFWKQNDTGLYGRRHDMVIKYLASRPDVRKVIVFDAPLSQLDLQKLWLQSSATSQSRWVCIGTYQKMLGVYDDDKISYNVFVMPPGVYSLDEKNRSKPYVNEGYIPFIQNVLKREGVVAEQAVFWFYPKCFPALGLIEALKPAQVVVDVVDDHRAWPNISDLEKQRLTEHYQTLLARADCVMSNCTPVQESMQNFFPGTLLVPNGCDLSPPAQVCKHSLQFEKYQSWSGKIIGYVGNLESKIDIPLLELIAETFTDTLLVLVGSTHTNPNILKLKKYHNILMPGVVPYHEVGAWIKKFTVGIVPHLDTVLTRNMNPLKIFSYLAFGVPVVSTEVANVDLTEGLVYGAVSHQTFINLLRACLHQPRPTTALVQAYLQTNSWEARLKAPVDTILGKLKSQVK
jgi:glycosyltransferase involved in cell wall biosynthesis